MRVLDISGVQIELEKKGASRYSKVSYPQGYGIYTEIKTGNYIFDFDLNGEIKYITGRGEDWPHPQEWLKRTKGNDWMYYFSGGYSDIFDCIGEYYLPCFNYPTNTLWTRDPFADKGVQRAMQAWKELPGFLRENGMDSSRESQEAINRISSLGPGEVWKNALKLFSLLEGRVSVLPPDCRHVDYDCIPVVISDGCLYNCKFCSVKSNMDFRIRSRQEINTQIENLRKFYSMDLKNYCAVFLGMHDALNCPRELLEYSALQAYERLELDKSYLRGESLYLFGSVDSFLTAQEEVFSMFEALPCYTYINLGLESADQATLDNLGKPVQADKVRDAFFRMQDINKKYKNMEVTANFLMDLDFSRQHWDALFELIREGLNYYYHKGTVYLSPLRTNRKREQIHKFKEIKKRSRLPLYLYLIQRL